MATPHDKSQLRSGALLILFTPDQRAAIHSAALADGLADGAWIRSLALREVARRMAATPEIVVETCAACGGSGPCDVCDGAGIVRRRVRTPSAPLPSADPVPAAPEVRRWRCTQCARTQIHTGKASDRVACRSCGAPAFPLASSRGGK